MKTTLIFRLFLLTVSLFTVLPHTATADITKWSLPEGAVARLGKGRINDVTYSPDGRLLAVASSIGIWLYDAHSGQELNLITGHTSWVWSVVFSPDGQTIATGGNDNTVRLWDVQSGVEKRRLTGHVGSVYSVSFSPDGRTIASSSRDQTIRLWDVQSGVEKRRLTGHTFLVRSVSFSPDGRTIASSSRDQTIRLWDVQSSVEKRRLTGHTDTVYSVVFSPDGQTLASGSWDETVRLWDVQSGVEKQRLIGHTDEVWSVVFSPDGQTLASGSWDGTVRLWDVETSDEKRRLIGHTHSISSIAFSPDGQMLASGSWDGTVRLWNIGTGIEKHQLTGHADWVNSVVFSPDGQTLASGSSDETVRLWDVQSGVEKRRLIGHTDGVNSVVFSPDGQTLASGGYDNTLRLWDVQSGVEKRQFTGHTDGVNSVVFSPDGQTLASGSSNGTVLLWRVMPTEPTEAPTTDATINISPASVASPAIGEQLEFSLNIIDGEAVAGYQATVQFDDTALRYISSTNGDFLPAGAFFVEPKVESNLIKLNAASLAGENNGDGTLATLTFEVIAMKASTLTLSDVLLTDNAGKIFVPHLEKAEITESTGLKGDVNGDGIVNIADLVLVASNLGETGQNAADVNGDGTVNIADLVLVAGALGNSAAAPSLHPQVLEMLTATEVEQWLSIAQQLNLTDTTSQRGILFLQQLLIALTPKETALLANYPNPFNPETWIPYHLEKDADVTLHIYAVNGTLVRTLALGHQPAGMYQNRSRAAYWDGKNQFGEPVASGVYFYTLTAGDFTATRKMLIRK